MAVEISELEQIITRVKNLSALDKVRLVEQVMATLEQDLAARPNPPRRSLYGLWDSERISEAEINEMRQAVWNNFPREDVS